MPYQHIIKTNCPPRTKLDVNQSSLIEQLKDKEIGIKEQKTCVNKEHDHISSIHTLIQEKGKVPSHQCQHQKRKHH